MNHPKNGFAIEAWRQAARSGEPAGHHLYNLRVEDGLNKIQNKVGLQDPAKLKEEIVKFEDFLRNLITLTPGKHLNDIVFTYNPN